MRLAINAAIIRDKRILVVKKNQTWIFPGGKPESNEGDLECLAREVREELSGTCLENIRNYGEFQGRTPHKGDVISARVYLADVQGSLNVFSQEILGMAWINYEERLNYKMSEITLSALERLRREDYI